MQTVVEMSFPHVLFEEVSHPPGETKRTFEGGPEEAASLRGMIGLLAGKERRDEFAEREIPSGNVGQLQEVRQDFEDLLDS